MVIPPLKQMLDDLGMVVLTRHANGIYEAKCEGRSELGDIPDGALFHLWNRRSEVLKEAGAAPKNRSIGNRGPIYLVPGIEIGEIPTAGQD